MYALNGLLQKRRSSTRNALFQCGPLRINLTDQIAVRSSGAENCASTSGARIDTLPAAKAAATRCVDRLYRAKQRFSHAAMWATIEVQCPVLVSGVCTHNSVGQQSCWDKVSLSITDDARGKTKWQRAFAEVGKGDAAPWGWKGYLKIRSARAEVRGPRETASDVS